MRSPTRFNPFAKSVASITNADLTKPLIQLDNPDRLFFPTFETRGAIFFWIGYVLFFSIFGEAIGTNWFKSGWEAWVFLLIFSARLGG